jgi:hypothetical protein
MIIESSIIGYAEGMKDDAGQAVDITENVVYTIDKLRADNAAMLAALQHIVSIKGSTKGAKSLVREFQFTAINTLDHMGVA